MKNLGIIGIAIIIVIFGGEITFAFWLQDLINSVIPKDEYYNLIHLVSIVAHIFILGGLYTAIAIYSTLALILLIKK